MCVYSTSHTRTCCHGDHTHQQSNGGEGDVDVNGLQSVLAGDLHTQRHAGRRNNQEKVRNKQLEALEPSAN